MILSALVQDSFNANVSMVTDPRQVENKLNSDNTNLLFLDIEMPYLSGLDVISLVRKKYSFNELPIIIISGKEGSKVRNDAFVAGANDFIRKPFEPEEVVLRTHNIITSYQHANELAQINEQLEEVVSRRTQELLLANEMLIRLLARAGELRDDNSGYHVVQVGLYARVLAEALHLPNVFNDLIAQATALYDIGKIAVSDNLLLTPDRLAFQELNKVESYPDRAEHLINGKGSGVMQVARSVIINHHEKWDGSGYPAQLQGKDIPIEGRIVAVVDFFYALTTVRSYKQVWTNDAAIAKIQSESGKAFDPDVVAAFVNNFDKIRQIQIKYSDCKVEADQVL